MAGSGTDYYKLYNQLYGYGYAGLCSVLTISHLLAWLLGVGVTSDAIVWMFAYVFFFPLLHLAGGALIFLAYNNAYTVSQDTTSSHQATALALMTTIKNEVIGLMTMEAGRRFEEK